MWKTYIKGFRAYLILERSLSENSVEAYIRDVHKLASFDVQSEDPKGPLGLTRTDISSFISTLYEIGMDARSQARILSGIKAFYKYLLLEDLIDQNPTQLIEGPKISRKLPDTLSFEEIQQILDAIDLSLPHAHRNKAIIETLYACGLRVSELVNLQLSFVYPDEGFVRVIGKNNKERLVPIAPAALKAISLYVNNERRQLKIQKGNEDFVFLNRRGKKLTRVMIFLIVKEVTSQAGINKNVSPHTFRHSFATHLVEGGADLRAVQDMLGHESIITTEIYTHVNTDYLRETLLMYHPGNKKSTLPIEN